MKARTACTPDRFYSASAPALVLAGNKGSACGTRFERRCEKKGGVRLASWPVRLRQFTPSSLSSASVLACGALFVAASRAADAIPHICPVKIASRLLFFDNPNTPIVTTSCAPSEKLPSERDSNEL